MAQTLKEPILAPTSEDYEKLLHLSYLVVSEANVKAKFFRGIDLRASSTLIFLDLLKYWGHPVTMFNLNGAKKSRESNNLLLLEVDSAWNQSQVVWEGVKYKAFDSWGSFATHVSDLLTFRESFFLKYSWEKFNASCYDIDTETGALEYWYQISQKIL